MPMIREYPDRLDPEGPLIPDAPKGLPQGVNIPGRQATAAFGSRHGEEIGAARRISGNLVGHGASVTDRLESRKAGYGAHQTQRFFRLSAVRA